MSRKGPKPPPAPPATPAATTDAVTYTPAPLRRPRKPAPRPRMTDARVSLIVANYRGLRAISPEIRTILYLAQDLEESRTQARAAGVTLGRVEEALDSAIHLTSDDVQVRLVELRESLFPMAAAEPAPPSTEKVPRFFYRSDGTDDEWVYIGTEAEARWELAALLEGDLDATFIAAGRDNGIAFEIHREDMTQEEVDAIPET